MCLSSSPGQGLGRGGHPPNTPPHTLVSQGQGPQVPYPEWFPSLELSLLRRQETWVLIGTGSALALLGLQQ